MEVLLSKTRYALIGHGTYSFAEAERLTGVPAYTIRRWTKGYSYRYQGEDRHSPPIIATHARYTEGGPALDFADLLEVRFLDAFRRYGVGAWAIRIASLRAQELLGRPRPFSTQIFKTDGRTVLAELVPEAGDPHLLDLVRDQYEFSKVVDPFLYSGIEFNQLQEPCRWWPLGDARKVVIDPKRSFGAPIVSESGVPTAVLAAGFAAEGSLEFVAQWYRVTLDEVKDAVEFETSHAA